MIRWPWVVAGALMAACAQPIAPATDARRSAFDDMSPALQTIQRDPTQHPGMLWVREGQALWQRQCARCHAAGLQGVAARYPAFDAAAGRVRTLAERIDGCRVTHGGDAAQGADGDAVLALSAWLAQESRGTPIAPPRDARLDALAERGAQLWRLRLGQLNLSCAQCHDERAGARLGGATIPQAHPTGYPVYRLEWQALGSLERRLRGCVVGVRAEPFASGGKEWVALEAYLMQRARGMVFEGVGVRP